MKAERKLAAWLAWLQCAAPLLTALFLLSGCASSAARAPRASGSANRGFGSNDATIRVKAKATVDNDADGIPDSAAPAAVPVAERAPGNYPQQPPMTGNHFAAPAKAPAPADAKKPEVSKDQPKDAPRADGTEAPHETSMLIYTAKVTMAVYQVDQGVAAVERLARDNGGFLALKRDREITIRVPRGRFDITLAAIDKIGDVLHRDIQAQDVTDEFVDTEIRIKNARAMQVRLKVLLDKANVKEALEIEKEMRRVTEEIELLEGKLKLLKDKIAYSTITVSFEPRGSTIQTTRIKLPFPWLVQLGLPALLQLSEDR